MKIELFGEVHEVTMINEKDFMYSDGFVQNFYELHALGGKVFDVQIFTRNGITRITDMDAKPSKYGKRPSIVIEMENSKKKQLFKGIDLRSKSQTI